MEKIFDNSILLADCAILELFLVAF